MQIFKFLEPFFHALSDGKLIRLTVAWVLRTLGMIIALAGVLGFIAILGFTLKSNPDASETHSAGVLIGGVLLALFVLAWAYLSAGILVFRANSVEELGDSHFTVLSILSLLFRLNGELMFVMYSLLGVGGCLFVWFTDTSPFSQLGLLGERLPFAESSSSGFLGGIELAILFLLIAFAGIVFSYALAELSVVLVEIALNTRGLRSVSSAAVVTPAPVFQPTPIPVQPPPAPVEQPQASAKHYCKQCGQPLGAGAAFCDECGTQVR